MAVVDICRTAWNSSKRETQPAYDDLIESYRDMLTARAEAVLATGMVDDGPFAGFEQQVLNAPPEPAVSSDQGYEQVVDVEVDPFEVDAPHEPSTEISHEMIESVAEAQPDPPKKKPLRKVVVAVKKAAAKKPTPKPKVIKKKDKK